jgi:radical SAM protein with 4Fe4S-binding SPASM domain
VSAGSLRELPFREIWENSRLFETLRDTNNLEGKCGVCEFVNVCLGCRARAFGATGNYLGEEPFCIYQPRHGQARGLVQ